MTTETTHEPTVAAGARQDAAWARMEQVTTRATASAPPAQPPLPRAARRRRPRHRLRNGLLALLTFAALFGAAFMVTRDLRRTAPPSPPPHAGAPVASTAPLESAVVDVQGAVAAAKSGLAALTGIPTPASVAPVTDAYVASLRLFEQTLAVTSVPARARAAAGTVAAQVRSDVRRLPGVADLAPATLGAYLADLTARMQRLDAALGSLHDALVHAPTR